MRFRLPASLVLGVLVLGCRPGLDDTGDTSGDDTDTSDTGGDSDTGTDTGSGRASIRIVHWNVEFVGEPGTTEYNSLITVLDRIDADVVCIDEIEDAADAPNFVAAAQELGYDGVFTPQTGNPNAYQRNGAMTRLPVISVTAPTSDQISGDSNADDLTRLPIVMTVDLPDSDHSLTVVCQHWKSGFEDVDEFRKLIDSHRTMQAAVAADSASEWVLAMGDVNAEVDEPPTSQNRLPSPFTTSNVASPVGSPGTFPDTSDLPSGYHLGSDLQADLADGGLTNDPFAPWNAAGFETADAVQQDGVDRATRWVSGRRIDYIFVGPAVPDGWQTEVFDCADDDLGGLPKPGDPITAGACTSASDHLPVIIDLAP